MGRAFIAAMFAVSVLLAIGEQAHDPDGKWDEWFLLRRNLRGASCCDISHAHYLNEGDWRSDGNHYQVKVGDRWRDVQDWQMLKRAEPNRTGRHEGSPRQAGLFFAYPFPA